MTRIESRGIFSRTARGLLMIGAILAASPRSTVAQQKAEAKPQEKKAEAKPQPTQTPADDPGKLKAQLTALQQEVAQLKLKVATLELKKLGASVNVDKGKDGKEIATVNILKKWAGDKDTMQLLKNVPNLQVVYIIDSNQVNDAFTVMIIDHSHVRRSHGLLLRYSEQPPKTDEHSSQADRDAQGKPDHRHAQPDPHHNQYQARDHGQQVARDLASGFRQLMIVHRSVLPKLTI